MIDTKFFKPVSAQISGIATDVGSFPAPEAPGSTVGAAISTSGVLYVAQIASDGSVELTLNVDDTATITSPVGAFIAAIHRTTLPSYTDGDGGILHLDNRGRLLVSTGESALTADVETDQDPAPATPIGTFVVMKFEAALPTYTAGDAVTLHSDNRGRLLVSMGESGLTADVETDQDPAPATPIGSFIVMKFESSLPTYAAGDASTIHSDSRGRLITTSIDPVTGNSFSIATDDSAGPTNPVGTFPMALFRTVLPTYTDGDAANLHVTASGLLRTDATLTLTLASAATTASIAGSASSTTLLASNTSRLGATFFNDQPTDDTGEILFLLLDAAVASTTNYTVQLAPNTYYEVPFGYTGEIRGIWGAAVGDVRVTELT